MEQSIISENNILTVKGESVPMDDTIQQIASNEDETYNVEEPLLELERALPKIKDGT